MRGKTSYPIKLGKVPHDRTAAVTKPKRDPRGGGIRSMTGLWLCY